MLSFLNSQPPVQLIMSRMLNLMRWSSMGKEESNAETSIRKVAKDRFLYFIAYPSEVKIDLSGLNLTSLPDVFDLPTIATRLKILDLSHNKLETLPPEIAKIATLKEISVIGNPLESLPTFKMSVEVRTR